MAAPNPGLLAAMLKANRLSGAMRWKVNFTEAGFKGEANLAAWNGIWLDTSDVKSIQDFVDVTAIQISSPHLVGHTLAELVSAIFSGGETAGSTCVAWSGWQDLIKVSAQDAQTIAESFDQACSESSGVVLICDSVGSFPGISELSQG